MKKILIIALLITNYSFSQCELNLNDFLELKNISELQLDKYAKKIGYDYDFKSEVYRCKSNNFYILNKTRVNNIKYTIYQFENIDFYNYCIDELEKKGEFLSKNVVDGELRFVFDYRGDFVSVCKTKIGTIEGYRLIGNF